MILLLISLIVFIFNLNYSGNNTDEAAKTICSQPIDPGSCDKTFKRFAFAPEEGNCREFTYGGCGGNR